MESAVPSAATLVVDEPPGQKPQPPARAPLALDRPWVVAHRGASGVLPEHTVPAYERAVQDGADFIECDVVITLDLQLICRHEPNLNETTNAWQLPEFRARARTAMIDGEPVSGIFAADFTLAELGALRARQAWPFRDHSCDGAYRIPTLHDFLDVAERAPRVVGIYPEVKHPSWHNELPALLFAGVTAEALVACALHGHGWGLAPLGSPGWLQAPVFIQSFELGSLRRLAGLTDAPLALLLGGWPGWVAPDSGKSLEQLVGSQEALAEVRRYAAVAAPWKGALYGVQASGRRAAGSGTQAAPAQPSRTADSAADESSAGAGASAAAASVISTGLAARLRAAGLLVHTYTLRDEARFVPAPLDGDIGREFALAFGQEGVSGGFADYPATLHRWLQSPAWQQAGAGRGWRAVLPQPDASANALPLASAAV